MKKRIKKSPRNPKKASEKELLEMGVYKGYDMKWLRNEPSHPDFYLVEEYDKKHG